MKSDGYGSKFFDPARVGSASFGLGLDLEITNFSIFSLWVKKISSGWVKKFQSQRRVGLLFTAGQSRLKSGQGPFQIRKRYLLKSVGMKDLSAYLILEWDWRDCDII